MLHKYYAPTKVNLYKQCPRKYKFLHLDGIYPIGKMPSNSLLFGDIFHLLIANDFLKNHPKAYVMDSWITSVFQKAGIPENATDHEALRQIAMTAEAVLNYAKTQICLGTRYRLVRQSELFDTDSDQWIVEYPLYVDDEKVGIIDAILYDLEQEKYVIVDWKTRYQFSNDNPLQWDIQLLHYAHFVNQQSKHPITEVRMIEIRNRAPEPAKLKQDGTPSMAAQTTTYSVWAESLRRHGLNPDDYPEMKDKLKTDADYYRELSLTLDSNLVNAHIEEYEMWCERIYQDELFPPNYSSFGCGNCHYNPICQQLKKGLPADDIMVSQFKHYTQLERIAEDED